MATEAKDDLRSTQLAQILDLWSEGPITGLVNGLKSVYLDKVPVENADGTRNFENVQFDWVRGTQDQAALPGITAVQNEVSVGVTVTAATPVVRSIATAGVDAVRVTLATGQLTTANPDNGDLNGAAFDYAIDVKSGGGSWVERVTGTVKGKTTSVYRRAVKVQLQGAGPWDIRVRRLTPDSTSQLLQNAFTWTSYTEIKTLKLRMPNSAVSALTVNAANFQRIPERAFDVLGLEIEVPTNYDPINRAYSGAWDGTFKLAWTNNPAWVFYAMGTNTRWGLGRYVTPAQLNKWQLYTIGRYCDVQVPSGRKNPDGTPIMEPRFTIGLYMQTRGEARQVMQDLAALFRSIAFWAGGQLQTVQDAPSDPTMLFTPSNVVDGLFQYQSSSDLQRHSVFIVYWNDLSQFGLRVPEVYVDEAAVARYGIRELALSPIGTTIRGQAQRLARWAAYSEAMEGETVSFKVGSDGALVLPGKVFEIADPSEAGDRMGGRVHSATTLAVTLDAPVELRGGEAYTLSVQLPDAAGTGYVTEERPVTTAAGAAVGVVSVFPAFSAAPAPEAVWLLQSDAVAATTWRCLGVVEVAGKDQFEISGVRHDPAKFDLIEQGVRIEPRPISRVRTDAPQPTNLTAVETIWMDGAQPRSRVTVSWLPGGKGLTHQLSYRFAAGALVTLPETSLQTAEINDLPAGELVLFVRAQNSLGNTSPAITTTLQLTGKTAAPAAPTGLAATVAPGAWTVRVNDPPDADWTAVDVRIDGASWDTATQVFRGRATRASMPFLAAGSHTLRARVFAGVRFSAEATTTLQVNAPSAPTINGTSASVGSVEVRFADCTATQPLRQVLCRVGSTSQQWMDVTDYAAASANARSLTVVFSAAGTRRIFLRGVDVAGNLGDIAYVDVVPQAMDQPGIVALLQEALTGSQLAPALRASIDKIEPLDTSVQSLGLQVARIDPLQADTRLYYDHVSQLAAALAQLALKTSSIDGVLRDAGVAVDPQNGRVTISAIEQTASTLTALQVRLDAQASTISLKASTTYVDQQIAAAVLDGGTVVFDGLAARVSTAEVAIDGLQATVSSKAGTATVDAQGLRLTNAETSISGLQGTIVNKADTTTVVGINGRLTTAENTLAASSSNAAQVTDLTAANYRLTQADADNAAASLQALLAAHQLGQDVQMALASVHDEVTAKINDDVSAEATARRVLAAVVGNVAAGLSTEQTVRAGAVDALTQAINLMQTAVGNNASSIAGEAVTRASETGALASKSESLAAANFLLTRADVDEASNTLASLVAGHQASMQLTAAIAAVHQEVTTKINGDVSAEAATRQALAVALGAAQAALQVQQSTTANQVSAQAQSISTLQAGLDSTNNTLATVQQSATASANTLSSQAQSITNLQAGLGTTNNNLAAVQDSASTSASAIAGLKAQRVLKTVTRSSDGKEAVASIGLASTSNGTAGQSEIIIMGDRLTFVPSGSPDATPLPLFTNQVINGVQTLVINAAAIGVATIGTLYLADDAISDPYGNYTAGPVVTGSSAG